MGEGMTDFQFWLAWLLVVCALFVVLEWRGLRGKNRGDLQARTLTDVVQSFMDLHWSARLSVAVLLMWMFLHFLGIGGL